MRFNLLTQSLHNALAILSQAKPTNQSGLHVSIIQGRTVQAVGSIDTGKIPLCILNSEEQVIICKLLGMDAQPLPAVQDDSAVQDAYVAQVEKCADLQVEIDQLKAEGEHSRANFAEAQREVSALNRTIEKLRNLSPAALAPQAPRVFAFCVSFPQGMQTKTLSKAGITLEQLRERFKFKFEDSKDPTKGGRWEPIAANDDETRKLASLLVSHGAVSSMSSQTL